jgi:hypothetical protein
MPRFYARRVITSLVIDKTSRLCLRQCLEILGSGRSEEGTKRRDCFSVSEVTQLVNLQRPNEDGGYLYGGV